MHKTKKQHFLLALSTLAITPIITAIAVACGNNEQSNQQSDKSKELQEGPQGPRGIQGPKGEKGDPGKTDLETSDQINNLYKLLISKTYADISSNYTIKTKFSHQTASDFINNQLKSISSKNFGDYTNETWVQPFTSGLTYLLDVTNPKASDVAGRFSISLVVQYNNVYYNEDGTSAASLNQTKPKMITISGFEKIDAFKSITQTFQKTFNPSSLNAKSIAKPDLNYQSFRIPSLLKTNDGMLINLDGRIENVNDSPDSNIEQVFFTANQNGTQWSKSSTVLSIKNDNVDRKVGAIDATVAVDKNNVAHLFVDIFGGNTGTYVRASNFIPLQYQYLHSPYFIAIDKQDKNNPIELRPKNNSFTDFDLYKNNVQMSGYDAQISLKNNSLSWEVYQTIDEQRKPINSLFDGFVKNGVYPTADPYRFALAAVSYLGYFTYDLIPNNSNLKD
ncbi:Vmc-like lipoprotein signal peptide domain-containing protein [[Mycoplasma] testudinis]|uniref:Vmc-like lipoprotein signal peptide domain-containing protein n=1 Tax=[Mycoplasma] testudinis TaxID=33924 RepID=UPI00047FCBA5|nr:hypothetical protein [[Mycoplasma] testudinis]